MWFLAGAMPALSRLIAARRALQTDSPALCCPQTPASPSPCLVCASSVMLRPPRGCLGHLRDAETPLGCLDPLQGWGCRRDAAVPRCGLRCSAARGRSRGAGGCFVRVASGSQGFGGGGEGPLPRQLVLLPALGEAAGLDKGKHSGGSRTKAEPYSACVAGSSLWNGSWGGKSRFILQTQHLVESRARDREQQGCCRVSPGARMDPGCLGWAG